MSKIVVDDQTNKKHYNQSEVALELNMFNKQTFKKYRQVTQTLKFFNPT
jgi:hypothetical protein